MSWLSTTWLRFLLKLGSFFGKYLNEAQKEVSDLECYNTTVFVRNMKMQGWAHVSLPAYHRRLHGGGNGHTWKKSEQRDQQAQSMGIREYCVFGNSFSKEKLKFPNTCPVVCL